MWKTALAPDAALARVGMSPGYGEGHEGPVHVPGERSGGRVGTPRRKSAFLDVVPLAFAVLGRRREYRRS